MTVASQTVSILSVTAGVLNTGVRLAGSGITANTRIVSQLTSARSDGLPGGIGAYLVDTSQMAGSSGAPIALTGPLADTFLPFQYTYQLGLEPTYKNASLGQVTSDQVDAGATIPANSYYGVWESIETPSAAANQLPAVRNSSSYMARYEGLINNAGAIGTAASASASNIALSATSVAA